MMRSILFLLPLLVVRASIIGKKPPSFETLKNKKAPDHLHRPLLHKKAPDQLHRACKQGDLFCNDGAYGAAPEKPVAQDSVLTSKTTTVLDDAGDVKPQAPESGPEKCLCDIQGNKCTCNEACDKRQEIQICAALLGPCVCEERGGSMCECSGHCPAMGDIMHACQTAPGCIWDGAFCAAEKSSPKTHYGSEKKSAQEELLDAAEAEAKKAVSGKAFKLPKYVQALCALAAAGLAAFVLLQL